MAVTVDGVSAALTRNQVSDDTNTTGDITTVSAAATYALILLEASLSGGNNDSAISFTTQTLEGTPISQIANAKKHSGSDAGTTGYVDLYELVSPPTGANVTLSLTEHCGIPGMICNLNAFAVTFLEEVSTGTPVRQNGAFVSSLTITDTLAAGELLIAICCNGASAPGVTVGTSIATATGDTSTSSHGGVRIATNTGVGPVSITFSTNNADNSAAVGIRLTPLSTGPTGNRAAPTVSFVKQVGTVTNTTGATSDVITVAAGGVPVGDTVVIVGSHDNSGSGGAVQATTISDTRGNTWTVLTPHAIADPGAANAGQEGWIAYSTIVVALQTSDSITISYPASTTAKAIRADQFHNLSGLVDYQHQDNQTGQAVSVTVTPTQAGQLVIGGVMVEGGTADAFTQDSDTTNGSWVNPGRLGSGTTTSGATLNPIYKIVTAAGAQTYDGATMLGTSRDHCAALAVFGVLPYPQPRDGRNRRRRGSRRTS